MMKRLEPSPPRHVDSSPSDYGSLLDAVSQPDSASPCSIPPVLTPRLATVFLQDQSTELRQESWVAVVVSPALSRVELVPGESIQVTCELLPEINLVDLEVRLVGSSEVASKHRHEFVSVPFKFDRSLLSCAESVDNSSQTAVSTGRKTLSVSLTLPTYHNCDCGSIATGPLGLTHLPSSYASASRDAGNKIEYALEVRGKYHASRDPKGKGKAKWNPFADKPTTQRFSIPFRVNADSLFDPDSPSPPPLAREETYRTYPISQESTDRHGGGRVTVVELVEPRYIGLVAKVKRARLVLEPTKTKATTTSSSPSFKYTLVVWLGDHAPSSVPLVSASVSLASPYVHFVLEESTTTIDHPPGGGGGAGRVQSSRLGAPAARRETSVRTISLVPFDPSASSRATDRKCRDDDPTDESSNGGAGGSFLGGLGDTTLLHGSRPGIIDRRYEFGTGENDCVEVRWRGDHRGENVEREETTPTWLEFRGELSIETPPPESIDDDDDRDEEGEGESDPEPRQRRRRRRLVPVRTCQLEVRYDLTATFQFGPKHGDSVMLKSTGLPLHLEAFGSPTSTTNATTKPDLTGPPASSSSLLPTRGGFPPGGSSRRPRTPTTEDLPAYDDRDIDGRDVGPLDEKRCLTDAEAGLRNLGGVYAANGTDISSAGHCVPPDPPAYPNDSTDAMAAVAVPSNCAPHVGRQRRALEDAHAHVLGRDGDGEGDLPPSWEEAVRDNMVDDWLAASVALGCDDQRPDMSTTESESR